MIILRYLAKEVYAALIAVTLVLIFILITNRLLYFLSIIAEGKLAASVLLRLMLLQIPYLLGMLLPMGLYIAILLVYGRMYVDSEVTVMTACGISRGQLTRYTLFFSSFVVLAILVLMLWLNPKIAHQRDEILLNQVYKSIVSTIEPGRFQKGPQGKRIFYIQKISKGRKRIGGLFVAEPPEGKNHTQWSVMTAKKAHQWVDTNTGNRFLEAVDGIRYSGMPGQANFKVASFKGFSVRLQSPSTAGFANEQAAMSTSKLIKEGLLKPKIAAEFQWRLSMPISAIILAFLAVPLSKASPRQGRFAQLLPAIMIYIIYAALIFMARAWIQNGNLSPWIGVWWVHGLLALTTLAIYAATGQWFKSKTPKQVVVA